MGHDESLGHRVTFHAMPFLMLVGAIMSLGAGFYLPPFVLLSAVFTLCILGLSQLKSARLNPSDARFVLVPAVVFCLGTLTEYHLAPAFYDQAYHLQISNRILDTWTWQPTHQGMDYSFRPEIVSGIAAVELFLTGKVTTVYVVPTMLLITSAWSIQHFAEHLTDKRFGFLAAVVFCTFPVTIMYGRTLMLDTVLAGMVIATLHLLITANDHQHRAFVSVGVLSAIAGLTKYAYLYLGPWIALMLFATKKKHPAKCIIYGYVPLLAVFMLKNQIWTGAPFGPLQSQLTGTMASVSALAAGEEDYTFRLFLDGFVGQWFGLVLCFAMYGSALLLKHRNRPFLFFWIAIAPAIVLHGYILDFGWERYSTPWLAGLCIGVPAVLVYFKDEFGGRFQHIKAPTVILLLVLLTSVEPVWERINETGPSSEWLNTKRSSWADIYADVGGDLPDDAVLLTTLDITMGLHAQTPAYRHEDPNYAILQGIEKFDASHLFTQQSEYRFGGHVDVNMTLLFGSPIEPISKYESNGYVGYLWEVNETRLQTANYWQNTTLSTTGNAEQSGDFLWLEGDAQAEIPDSMAIRAIYETSAEKNLDEMIMMLATNRSNLLCGTVSDCSAYDRNARLDTNWAVWLVHGDE